MAHMRYLIYADVAEREKYVNVARLFKAIAFAEFVHARNHSKELSELKDGFTVTASAPFGPGGTSKNLELAIMGEAFEVEEMYPAYLEIAKLQNERGAERSFTWALEVEKIHGKLYREAKKRVDKGDDWTIEGKIWICGLCGHTYVGTEPPERCPICKASRKQYKGF